MSPSAEAASAGWLRGLQAGGRPDQSHFAGLIKTDLSSGTTFQDRSACKIFGQVVPRCRRVLPSSIGRLTIGGVKASSISSRNRGPQAHLVTVVQKASHDAAPESRTAGFKARRWVNSVQGRGILEQVRRLPRGGRHVRTHYRSAPPCCPISAFPVMREAKSVGSIKPAQERGFAHWGALALLKLSSLPAGDILSLVVQTRDLGISECPDGQR